jgi:hypothetical protein
MHQSRFEITPAPSITPTIVILPSPSASNSPACLALNSSTESSDGWNCVSEKNGFSIHFPREAEILRSETNLVDVRLYKSAPDPNIERMIEIFTGEKGSACFSPSFEKVQIGGQDFVINHGVEPSGVVYAWKSYAIEKGTQKVCFFFMAGYQTFSADNLPVPPEKDQGLDDIESILATFNWLAQ